MAFDIKTATPVQVAPNQSAPGGYNPPWTGFSPKGTEEEKSKQWEAAQKRIDILRGMTNEAESKIPMLNRFGALNRRTSTGGLAENIMSNNAYAQSLLHPAWAENMGGGNQNDINEMVSIQSKLGPQEKPTGAGTSSDRDVNLYMRGLPNISTTGVTNKNLREDYIRTYKNAVIKRDFLERYLNTYRSLHGADQLWDKQKKSLGFDDGADTSDVRQTAAGGAQIHGTYNPRTGKIE